MMALLGFLLLHRGISGCLLFPLAAMSLAGFSGVRTSRNRRARCFDENSRTLAAFGQTTPNQLQPNAPFQDCQNLQELEEKEDINVQDASSETVGVVNATMEVSAGGGARVRRRGKFKRMLLFWRASRVSSASKSLTNLGNGLYRATIPKTKAGSVFEESKIMLILSDIVYAFTALREVARRTNDNALMRELSVPQLSSTLVPAIIRNSKLLKQNVDDAFVERCMMTVNKMELASKSPKENTDIFYMGDSADDHRASCVYTMAVNRSKKRFTVWFRGSVMDENMRNHWSTNLDTTLRCEENPVDELFESVSTFNLHSGFVRGLMGHNRKIISNILAYKKKFPKTKDYPLYVSGHSLGGALATLLGFYACQDPNVNQCGAVRVYTFAAPPVGDKNFGHIFRHFEETGKIKLARIHNALDPIPHSFALTKFRHVGLGIELDFPGYNVVEDRSSFGMILGALKAPSSHLAQHKLSTSYDYLNRHAIAFNETIDEMYYSRGFCGG